jgi:predicted transcriptional regulator
MQWLTAQWDMVMTVENPYDNFTDVYEYVLVNETVRNSTSEAVIQKVVKKKIPQCQPEEKLGTFFQGVSHRKTSSSFKCCVLGAPKV